MDPTYNLPLKIVANGKEIVTVSVAKWRLDTLTEEFAFDLACHESVVQEVVLPHEFERQKFVKQDSYEAVLTLTFNNPNQDYRKSMKMEKEQKKKDREAKKELAENEKRKAAQSLPKHNKYL